MDWIVGINFWGVVHGTKEFLPHLIASGDGHLVNLSSLFGLVSMPGQSPYNATKYAVRGLTEALREEMLIAGHRSASPRSTPAASRPRSPATPATPTGGRRGQRPALRQKLAKMTPERAAEIIVKGILGQQGAGAGRARRPRAAPPRQAHRLALPGHRRVGEQEGRAAKVSVV
jgi:NADP-dependent 3-hydroxy acid dehydrogenase YdfG